MTRRRRIIGRHWRIPTLPSIPKKELLRLAKNKNEALEILRNVDPAEVLGSAHGLIDTGQEAIKSEDLEKIDKLLSDIPDHISDLSAKINTLSKAIEDHKKHYPHYCPAEGDMNDIEKYVLNENQEEKAEEILESMVMAKKELEQLYSQLKYWKKRLLTRKQYGRTT